MVDLGGNELSLAIVYVGVACHLAVVTEVAGGDAIGSCVRVVREALRLSVKTHLTAQFVADRCNGRRGGWRGRIGGW